MLVLTLVKCLLACMYNKWIFLLKLFYKLKLSCDMVSSIISAKWDYSNKMTNEKIATLFIFAIYIMFNVFLMQKHLYFILPFTIQILHFSDGLKAEIKTNRARKIRQEK